MLTRNWLLKNSKFSSTMTLLFAHVPTSLCKGGTEWTEWQSAGACTLPCPGRVWDVDSVEQGSAWAWLHLPGWRHSDNEAQGHKNRRLLCPSYITTSTTNLTLVPPCQRNSRVSMKTCEGAQSSLVEEFIEILLIQITLSLGLYILCYHHLQCTVRC